MNLAAKLSTSVGAALVAGFVVTAIAGYVSTTKILENQIRGHLEDHAYNAMDKLERMLRERYADMRVLSTDPVLKSPGSTPGLITERLKKYKQEYPIYSSLSFFDLNRVRIADTSGANIGKQHAMTAYWKEIEAGRDIVMKITEARASKQVIVHYVAVVRDQHGARVGVVASRMPVENIYELVESSFKSDTDRKNVMAELLDREGLLLYSTHDKEGMLKERSEDWEFLKEEIALGKKSGNIRHMFKGEDEISAFASEQGHPGLPENGLTLVLCTPASAAFAPAHAQGKMFVYLFSAFTGIVLLIVTLTSRAVMAPLKKLARAAREIGKGNLDVRLEVSSSDEIGQLTSTFNDMAADLGDSARIIHTHEELMEKLNNALVSLARDERVYRGDLDTSLRVITETSARGLEVRRVSIWFYTEDNAAIRCADLYDLDPGEHTSGAVLAASTYPAYFKALGEEELISADDAIADARTSEFSEFYLKPLNITSMLDVPFRASGKVMGVVCHEHVGPPRSWTVEEKSFVTAIAGFTSAAIEISERKKAEGSLRASGETIRKLKEDAELKLDEAERINKLMVGRELKMAEMRAELQRLRARHAGPEGRG